MIVTLAGHVDHGKTSLVQALTGVDTDTLAEEKRRGLTIDIGFAYTDFGGERVGFVDVPGHHRFVHNMVAGVAARQFALLVVAADDGVMPQSHEHLQILSLLGLERGVVALNKADRADASHIAAVRDGIRALTAGTFLGEAPIVEVSCMTGDGIDELRQHLADAAAIERAADAAAPFRLPIDRAFTVRGSGAVITGTTLSGTVRVDDRLVLADSGTPVRVRGLRVQDSDTDAGLPGDRTAINLAGIGAEDIERGDWLLPPDSREPVTRLCIALDVLDDFPRAVKHNQPVHVYHATSHAQGRLLLIDETPLPGGDAVLTDVAASAPLHVKVGDRLVIRDHDLARTLGGGRVIELGTPPARRRSPDRLRRLTAIAPDDAATTAARLLDIAPLHASDFARQWNLAPERLDAAAPDHVSVDGYWIAPAMLEAAVDRIASTLTDHHRRRPDSTGLGEDELLRGPPDQRRVASLALRHLVAQGTVRVQSGEVALATHQAQLPADVLHLFERVEGPLDSTQPPSLGDVAKLLKRPFAAFERDMRALPAHGLAVRVSDTRFYLPARLLELADEATRLAAAGPFTVRDFRDATGVGRNVVIEVLEHFDRKGFTRRSGDTRTVIGERDAIL